MTTTSLWQNNQSHRTRCNYFYTLRINIWGSWYFSVFNVYSFWTVPSLQQPNEAGIIYYIPHLTDKRSGVQDGEMDSFCIWGNWISQIVCSLCSLWLTMSIFCSEYLYSLLWHFCMPIGFGVPSFSIASGHWKQEVPGGLYPPYPVDDGYRSMKTQAPCLFLPTLGSSTDGSGFFFFTARDKACTDLSGSTYSCVLCTTAHTYSPYTR